MLVMMISYWRKLESFLTHQPVLLPALLSKGAITNVDSCRRQITLCISGSSGGVMVLLPLWNRSTSCYHYKRVPFSSCKKCGGGKRQAPDKSLKSLSHSLDSNASLPLLPLLHPTALSLLCTAPSRMPC